MVEWTLTTPEQAAEIARLAVDIFGIDGLYVDMLTGPNLVIADALRKAGVEKVVAWDLQETVKKISRPYPQGIDVALIPYVFQELEILYPILEAQAPRKGAIIYRAPIGFDDELSKKARGYLVTRSDEHLILRPRGEGDVFMGGGGLSG